MSTHRWEIHLEDAEYPAHLRCCPDPPKVLYGVGDPGALRPGLAVIGARKATPYGVACARRFSRWAASRGICIISGAAVGCDIEAHEAALAVAGSTVAVLGCGADVDYPARSAATLHMLRRDSAVVSEVPWGSPPQRWAFSARNRIIAGLSLAVLVVEAGLPSGTFGTADHALAAGRDVLAVPGSILAPECRGANRLIAQGATPITCESELRDALFTLGLLDLSPLDTVSDALCYTGSDPLLRALAANPSRPDDLAFQMATDVIDVARRLSELELGGLVRRLRDGRYTLTMSDG